MKVTVHPIRPYQVALFNHGDDTTADMVKVVEEHATSAGVAITLAELNNPGWYCMEKSDEL